MRAGVLGLFAGLVPDLDILIRSSSDPMLFLEYHRQFTHSLVFIPIGGLLCALLYCAVLRKWDRRSFLQAWLFCTLGYGTHGMLDAFTSYGTQLLWPFSDLRVAFNIVSVVDPLFTLPVVILVILAARRRRPVFAGAALAWAALYLGVGYVQKERTIMVGQALAASRGHVPVRIDVKPSFANLVVWRIIYETGDAFFVDAVRMGGSPRVFEGTAIPKLDVARDFPNLNPQSQQARDIERFRHFSDGFIAVDPRAPNRIIDVRYSMVPNEVEGLWSIVISDRADPARHVAFRTHRESPAESFRRLWRLIVGQPAVGSDP